MFNWFVNKQLIYKKNFDMILIYAFNLNLIKFILKSILFNKLIIIFNTMTFNTLAS